MTRFLLPIFVMLCGITAFANSQVQYDIEILTAESEVNCGANKLTYAPHLSTKANSLKEAKIYFKNQFCKSLKAESATVTGACYSEKGSELKFKRVGFVAVIRQAKLVKRTNTDTKDINSEWLSEDIIKSCN